MKQFPHKIIILKVVNGGSPYGDPTYEQVYTGRCRCWLDKTAAMRVGKIADCDYQVTIPDRSMIEIGENYKVGIKFDNSKNDKTWDLVGYVKDFARYDRRCNIWFQMVKESIIYEDVPEPAYDKEERTNNTDDLEYMNLESVGMLNDDILLQYEVLNITAASGKNIELYFNSPEGGVFKTIDELGGEENIKQLVFVQNWTDGITNKCSVVCKHEEIYDVDDPSIIYEPQMKVVITDAGDEVEEKLFYIKAE